MVLRAILLQLFALAGNFCLFPLYYWVFKPLGASDAVVLAFSATIPLAYVASTAMLIWDEATRTEGGCLGWVLMVANLFLMALNVGIAVAIQGAAG